jgi:hypothetical protein
MQVNATLIAAQQAAREAQARFQTAHLSQRPAANGPAATGPTATGNASAANFAAALEKDLFEPLPLKQNTPAPHATAMANPAPTSRPGSLLDIKI